MTVTTPQPQGSPILRILLYHADAPTQRHVKAVLKSAGLPHVVAVQSARAIIDKLCLGRFDVLITSDQLPDLDAWRLARIVQSGRFGEHLLRIIVVCEDHEVSLLCASAANHHVRLLPVAQLEHLPELVKECSQSDARPWLLIVEDDPQSAELARSALGQIFNVEIANDGRNGLAAYERQRHDLVLLDLALPNIPGEVVLHRMRELDPTQPVVVVTANTSLDSHASLVLDGAYDFLVKPFDIDTLREACRLAIEQRAHNSMHSTREQLGGALQELRGRIYAAVHLNCSGKNQAATQHLKSAIRTCRLPPLTDDEWGDLKNQF